MKLRLNNPLQMFFAPATASAPAQLLSANARKSPSLSASENAGTATTHHQQHHQQPRRLRSAGAEVSEGTQIPEVPLPVHLQSVRALTSSGLSGGVIVRVRHMYVQ